MLRSKQISYQLAFVLLLIPSISFAKYGPCDSTFKIRGGAFIPRCDLFRDIYGKVGGFGELEIATHVHPHVEVWANANGFFKRGHSLGFCNQTRIAIGSGSIGLKFPYEFCNCFTLYLGAGPSFAGIWLKNKSICGCDKITKGSAGGVVKSGFMYHFKSRWFVDLFFDYVFQPTHFQRHIDVGGARIGLGLGISF